GRCDWREPRVAARDRRGGLSLHEILAIRDAIGHGSYGPTRLRRPLPRVTRLFGCASLVTRLFGCASPSPIPTASIRPERPRRVGPRAVLDAPCAGEQYAAVPSRSRPGGESSWTSASIDIADSAGRTAEHAGPRLPRSAREGR